MKNAFDEHEDEKVEDIPLFAQKNLTSNTSFKTHMNHFHFI